MLEFVLGTLFGIVITFILGITGSLIYVHYSSKNEDNQEQVIEEIQDSVQTNELTQPPHPPPYTA